jgi:hypothetical protein
MIVPLASAWGHDYTLLTTCFLFRFNVVNLEWSQQVAEFSCRSLFAGSVTTASYSGVGLVLYRPVDASTPVGRTNYEPVAPPRGLSIDDALRRMSREIRANGG